MYEQDLKGTSHDFIFQSSLFPHLLIFLHNSEPPPMNLLIYQSSHAETRYVVQGSQLFAVLIKGGGSGV